MTTGISALSGSADLSLINAVIEKPKKEDEEKAGDIFELMFQAIDDAIAQTQENLEKNINEDKKSEFNFGPPPNIIIKDASEENTNSFEFQENNNSTKELLSHFNASDSYKISNNQKQFNEILEMII